jgi:hypothetical protein
LLEIAEENNILSTITDNSLLTLFKRKKDEELGLGFFK